MDSNIEESFDFCGCGFFFQTNGHRPKDSLFVSISWNARKIMGQLRKNGKTFESVRKMLIFAM